MASSKGGFRSGSGPVARPIICVCNDIYAPALLPLREAARVFHLRAPPPQALQERLAAICKWEGVAVDKQVGRELSGEH